MLGSHFDLDRAIAQIASKRDMERRSTATRETHSEDIRAYSEFDRSLSDFVRAVGDRKETERHGADPDARLTGRADPGPVAGATLPGLAAVRQTAGSLGQIR